MVGAMRISVNRQVWAFASTCVVPLAKHLNSWATRRCTCPYTCLHTCPYPSTHVQTSLLLMAAGRRLPKCRSCIHTPADLAAVSCTHACIHACTHMWTHFGISAELAAEDESEPGPPSDLGGASYLEDVRAIHRHDGDKRSPMHVEAYAQTLV